jgi:hypothetical protein
MAKIANESEAPPKLDWPIVEPARAHIGGAAVRAKGTADGGLEVADDPSVTSAVGNVTTAVAGFGAGVTGALARVPLSGTCGGEAVGIGSVAAVGVGGVTSVLTTSFSPPEVAMARTGSVTGSTTASSEFVASATVSVSGAIASTTGLTI